MLAAKGPQPTCCTKGQETRQPGQADEVLTVVDDMKAEDEPITLLGVANETEGRVPRARPASPRQNPAVVL